ncbi:exodeoxyribonuclease VII large subunit [candidate division KSB1 bacterium]|nr:exodeoxyribonuclease VII large subunit [candidate division KSB1 bacterium]
MEVGSRQPLYSVSDITWKIKELLETSLPPIWVHGEISNFVHHSSGHMYFSLKDEGAQLTCVMWKGRNQSLYFTPQDGMKINALGSIRVYEKRGSYQLDCAKLIPAGVGELQLAFEQLKKKLDREGLFDPSRKKPIPPYPERIGVVTSESGAAFRDIVHVVRRRFPAARIILRPALVQGEGAATDIAAAIADFNRYKEIDVMIVGRGGGSIEDLWAFNEEQVARAVYESHIPVVSAVGHEIDFTISDFVADLRAPTPSAAAEMIVPDSRDLLEIADVEQLRLIMHRRLSLYRENLKSLLNSYGLKRPVDIIRQHQQRVDELNSRLDLTIQNTIDKKRFRLQRLDALLDGLDPQRVLERGYSICRNLKDQQIVTSAGELSQQDQLHIHFYQGGAEVSVEKIHQENLAMRSKDEKNDL